MWFKPQELTTYNDVGYEIVYFSTYPDDIENMAVSAIHGWKTSQSHNEMIINNNKWKSVKWKVMGVGIYKTYAIVWFGEQVDEDGAPWICSDK